ncbi:hypothetical protein BDW02DRAFT_573624 [Decorospora gaudefroyi]|uniref:Uncharacterized protein n=1 Tax=Decorospora gaudefroyi TaxID=184978 RepID=A0A6A5JY08_9PLEO|nr:hypothetical protein BDW02DRAFT_573624 [Decorospora gaudefroyi]
MKVRRQITTEELYYDYFHSFNPALWRWLRSSTTRSTLQTLLHRPTNLPQGLTSEGRNMIATFCARRPEQAGLFDRLAALTDHLFGDVFMQLIQMALTHFHRAAMPSTLIPVLMTMGDGPTPFMIAALIADDFLEECSKAGGGELGLHGQVLSPEHWSQLFRFRQSMWREARIDYPQFDSEDVELSASIPALLGLSERAEFLLDYDYRGPPLAGIRRQEGLLSFPIQGSHGASEEADVPHRTGHGMTRCEFLLGRGQNNIKVTEKESCALRDIVIDRSTGCITFSQADGWRLQLRIRGPVKDGSAPTSASAQTST